MSSQIDTQHTLQVIPLSAIVPNPNNPRKQFDQKALKELADSIRAHGVRQPILLRNDPAEGKFQIVCGERRWRASKLAGKSEVPAIVDPSITDRAALEIGILENLQRQDVHPLDEALGYKTLLDAKADPKNPKHTPDTIAAKVGKSPSYVYQRLKLAELSKSGQEDFRAGFISAAHAIDIARLQTEDQARALDFCHKQEWGEKRGAAPSFRDLRQWIQENVQLNLDKAPFDITDKKLMPLAGACIDCPKRSGSNPMLFEGIGKNTCMDPACYQAKKMALVNINVDQLQEKHGEKPILISHHYSSPGPEKKQKGILYIDSYRDHVYKAGKDHKIEPDSCPDTHIAVYVDNDEFSPQAGKGQGKPVVICTNHRKCKIHADSFVSTHGEGSAESRRNQRISNHFRRAAFKAIAAAMKHPTRADRELVAVRFFEALGHYTETPLIESLGWDKKLGAWNGAAARRKKFAGMKDPELEKHLVLMAVAADLAHGNNGSRKITAGPHMEAVARRHKVNLAKLLRESRDRFTKKPKGPKIIPARRRRSDREIGKKAA